MNENHDDDDGDFRKRCCRSSFASLLSETKKKLFKQTVNGEISIRKKVTIKIKKADNEKAAPPKKGLKSFFLILNKIEYKLLLLFVITINCQHCENDQSMQTNRINSNQPKKRGMKLSE